MIPYQTSQRTIPVSVPRRFLFLQGPHGPFFRKLAYRLRETGAEVERIGFTLGDHMFWGRQLKYHGYRGTIENWGAYLEKYILENGISDIVLYGDSRPLHQTAREIAEKHNLFIHCFEEGYLRPYWVTYERDGTNGNSPLMHYSVDMMREAVENNPMDLAEVPTMWGAIWHHAWYGFVYHAYLAIPNWWYRDYKPHREISVFQELLLYIRRLVVMPLHGLQRRIRTRRLLRSGTVYHLVLLQLSHDASLRSHSDFTSVGAFIDMVIGEFAKAAPTHHQLVFKAHPFEDEREPLPKLIRKGVRRHKLQGKVRFIPGGKLGPLLNAAKSIITVNSTAAQQALWRGLPLKAFGRSVFMKPEFVSDQPLSEFFLDPQVPNVEAYHFYRQFLLETSQVPGSFYTQTGRAELLRNLVDLMLKERDPYADFVSERLDEQKSLRIVASE